MFEMRILEVYNISFDFLVLSLVYIVNHGLRLWVGLGLRLDKLFSIKNVIHR